MSDEEPRLVWTPPKRHQRLPLRPVHDQHSTYAYNNQQPTGLTFIKTKPPKNPNVQNEATETDTTTVRLVEASVTASPVTKTSPTPPISRDSFDIPSSWSQGPVYNTSPVPSFPPRPTTPPPSLRRGIFDERTGWHNEGRIHNGTDNQEIRHYVRQVVLVQRRILYGPVEEVFHADVPEGVMRKQYRDGVLYETPIHHNFSSLSMYPLPVIRPEIFDNCPKCSDQQNIATGDVIYGERPVKVFSGNVKLDNDTGIISRRKKWRMRFDHGLRKAMFWRKNGY